MGRGHSPAAAAPFPINTDPSRLSAPSRSGGGCGLSSPHPMGALLGSVGWDDVSRGVPQSFSHPTRSRTSPHPVPRGCWRALKPTLGTGTLGGAVWGCYGAAGAGMCGSSSQPHRCSPGIFIQLCAAMVPDDFPPVPSHSNLRLVLPARTSQKLFKRPLKRASVLPWFYSTALFIAEVTRSCLGGGIQVVVMRRDAPVLPGRFVLELGQLSSLPVTQDAHSTQHSTPIITLVVLPPSHSSSSSLRHGITSCGTHTAPSSRCQLFGEDTAALRLLEQRAQAIYKHRGEHTHPSGSLRLCQASLGWCELFLRRLIRRSEALWGQCRTQVGGQQAAG